MKGMEYISTLVRSDREAWLSEQNAVHGAIAALERAYADTCTGTPKATVDAFTQDVGLDMARVIIASLVNQCAWDGRISKRAAEWAKTIDGAYDEKACERMYLYCERIHRAHLDQIANELMKR